MATLQAVVVLAVVLGAMALPEVEIGQGKRLYRGFKVLRSLPRTDGQRSALLRLSQSVDFWSEVGPRTEKVDIMVEPHQVTRVANYLSNNGIDFEVMISDLQADIDEENQLDFNSTVALPHSRRDKRQNVRQRGRARPRQRQRQSQRPLNLGDLWQHFAGPQAQRARRKPQGGVSLPVPAIDASTSNFQSSSGSLSSQAPAPPCAWTGMTWTQYQSYGTMRKWMECMAANFNDRAKLITIGKSSEGRPLLVMKIGTEDQNKPAAFIDGGIHAREWVSPAAVTYVIQRMLEGSEFSGLLDIYNVYILIVANPDGYEYSRNHDRMWRKTRSKTGKRNLFQQECHGVDPNRNFGFEWGGYGASDDACKETFRGAGPFSEPETRAMRDFILRERADFKLYLTFHSYGQYLLYPWGYDTLDTHDATDLHRVGNVAARALKQTNGVAYQLGSAAKMLYPASGGSDDWAKGGAGIKYSYTIELPDTGRHGFILPARFIRNVGFQAVTVVKSMLGAVRETLPK